MRKHHKHDHYWIQDGWLYESYNTIRGMRYLEVLEVPGMPDTDKCSDSCINFIQKEFSCNVNQS